MRVLFVSSTTLGGSGRSQRELAGRLVELGHTVQFLVPPAERRRLSEWWCEQWEDAAVKLARTPVGGLIRGMNSLNGRRVARVVIDGIDHRVSQVPEHAFASVARIFRPDVVVGNSIRRPTWRAIRAMCSESSVPTVLYVREDNLLGHFEPNDPPGDAFVANAQSLVDAIRLRGFDCKFIPSVIEVGVTRTASTRRVALVINPVESRGASIVGRIAKLTPEVPFVLQESWPLSPAELEWVETHLTSLPNVELRRMSPPGPGLYGDARVLLVPYRVDNRPRVIAEAQANGIPVIVGDVPALREAIGEGGVVVPLEDETAWAVALRTMWADQPSYELLSEGARRHGQRDEIDPKAVAQRFEKVLIGLSKP